MVVNSGVSVKRQDNKTISNLNQHPLQDQWMFWFNKLSKDSEFEAQLVKVHICKSVEEFWSVYKHIKHPNELRMKEDYSFFKVGVSPQWEDPANENGGRWVFSINNRMCDPNIDKLDIYLRLLLCLIGDSLGSDTDYINGVIVGQRRDCLRFNVWTSVCDTNAKEVGIS
ncbi:hypothetical protein MXB_5653 [Myxobolus squamalis]|nr:hypothetical protein MXB_5653 [Myxobolus squamalis]